MDKKAMRRAVAPAGWMMLIYFLILTVCTFIGAFVETMIVAVQSIVNGSMADMNELVETASQSTWGYFLAAAVGLLILLLWKKPKYLTKEIWVSRKSMQARDFWGITCLFFSAQMLYQIITTVTELLLNSMGYTMAEGMQMVSAGNGGLGMFLYIGILAPVIEEILCRGLAQKVLLPFGKRAAILGSAFLFALLHGNILQVPYAFAVGLVLGYVAAEYSIAWAMLLHMLNNLVLGEIFSRLTAGMNEILASALLWGFLIICTVGAIVTLVRKKENIGSWLRDNPLCPGFSGAFFGNAGVIIFVVLMALSIIGTSFVLFTPL